MKIVSRLKTVTLEDPELQTKQQQLYTDAKLFLEVTQVPELLNDLASAPATASSLWHVFRGVLENEHSAIQRTIKEYIALAAASSANAVSLRQLMLSSLEERGIDPVVLDELMKKGETLRLPERSLKILLFGRRAALDPARLRNEDFSSVRQLGLSESDIAELVMFSGIVAGLIAISQALHPADQESQKQLAAGSSKKKS